MHADLSRIKNAEAFIRGLSFIGIRCFAYKSSLNSTHFRQGWPLKVAFLVGPKLLVQAIAEHPRRKCDTGPTSSYCPVPERAMRQIDFRASEFHNAGFQCRRSLPRCKSRDAEIHER